MFSFAHKGTHNFCDGPPYLRCNAPHGEVLRSKLVANTQPWERELSVWVDGCTAAEATLEVRLRGVTVARATGSSLRVDFSPGEAAPGEPFVAELSWPGGRRWLHVLAPLPSPLDFSGLVLPPRGADACVDTVAAAVARDLSVPPALPAARPARGFGIELEALVEAPPRDGAAARLPPVEALRERLLAMLERLRAAASARGDAELAAAFERCAAWHVASDGDIAPTLQRAAERMVDAAADALPPHSEARHRARRA